MKQWVEHESVSDAARVNTPLPKRGDGAVVCAAGAAGEVEPAVGKIESRGDGQVFSWAAQRQARF